MTRLGVDARKRRIWTEVEIEMLRRHYADVRTADLATALGRPANQVTSKAYSLGMRKSPDLIAEIARQRSSDPNHPSRLHRFEKGHAPHNKGLKRPEGWAPGRMRETQFKAGGKPGTWVPVGTYRVNSDGVFEQKFSDDPGAPTRRWKAVSRLVWERDVGPVPDGHIVVFRPGMKPSRVDELEAYTVERLECISRAQNMARNTYHQYGREVAQLVQLRGVLTRAINRKTKERPHGDEDNQ